MTCSYDPRPLAGQPIGMFHCPLCGEMVIAGMEHPDWENMEWPVEPSDGKDTP